MNGNYNISRCNNMQGTGIYSLHTAMRAPPTLHPPGRVNIFLKSTLLSSSTSLADIADIHVHVQIFKFNLSAR